MAKIYIPYLNPLSYTDEAFVSDQLYASKHFDDVPYIDTIKPWQQKVDFVRVWWYKDVIRQQLISGISPVVIELVNGDNTSVVYATQNFQPKLQNKLVAGEFINEHDWDLNGATPGYYRFRLKFGTPVQKSLISEKFIVSENIENTLLLQYGHHENRGDIIFETGFEPNVRINGSLRLKEILSVDTTYVDQRLNAEMIKSDPYCTWDLVLNDEWGIPEPLAIKLNWIIGCSKLMIDGKLYTKSDGAKMESSVIERYPLRSYKIEVRDKLNRSSKVLVTEGDPNMKIMIAATSDSKGFGMDTGGNQSQIISLE